MQRIRKHLTRTRVHEAIPCLGVLRQGAQKGRQDLDVRTRE
jgi:hypothetical protein